ncbi:MAG: hypothetical protein WC677_04045 [Clostridia bacterium]|jgi:hypothetical protein
MKKFLAIVLSGIIFAMVLTSCGSSTDTNGATNSTATSTVTEVPTATSVPTATVNSAEKEIFYNGNGAGVQSNPTSQTKFTIDKAYYITFIMDYHYFNNGVLPGTIALKHSDGTIYGPWQAIGRTGQGGVNNAYWDATPNVQIKAGTYTVVDSNPTTWSQNSQSNNCGMTQVKGY